MAEGGLTPRQGWLLGDLVSEGAGAVNPVGRGAVEEALTLQQVRFIEEYIVDCNATQAAVRAGYSEKTAGSQGSRLMKNVYIRGELRRRLEERLAKSQLSIEGTLEQLRRLSHADIRLLYREDGTLKEPKDWPPDLSARIARVETEERYEQGGKKVVVKKVALWNPNDSLRTIAQYLRMLADGGMGGQGRVIDGDYSEMSDEDVIAEAKRLGRPKNVAA